jgi:hypothetical protein
LRQPLERDLIKLSNDAAEDLVSDTTRRPTPKAGRETGALETQAH